MSEPERNRPAHLELLAVAWNFGWPVIVGALAGSWLDQRLGTSPVLALFLGLGSIAIGAWRLIVLARREAAERRRLEEGPP